MKACTLYECKGCGLNFRFPQLSRDELEAFYRDLPSTYWPAESSSNEAWTLARTHLVSQFNGLTTPAILDVGAFTGGFLKTLPDQWCKAAIEPSKQAAEQLSLQGVELIAHFLHEEKLSRHLGEFDAIAMLDVFEHIERPLNAVRELAKLLKPDGVLLISTGNTKHWSWRMLKGSHWYLHSVQHCSFGNRNYFRNMGDTLGMKLKCVVAHSHQRSSRIERFSQSAEVLFAWGRAKTDLIKRVTGWFVYVPGFGYLRHKNSAPFSSGLRDHLLVILQKR